MSKKNSRKNIFLHKTTDIFHLINNSKFKIQNSKFKIQNYCSADYKLRRRCVLTSQSSANAIQQSQSTFLVTATLGHVKEILGVFLKEIIIITIISSRSWAVLLRKNYLNYINFCPSSFIPHGYYSHFWSFLSIPAPSFLFAKVQRISIRFRKSRFFCITLTSVYTAF